MKKNTKALFTLAIGEPYQRMWETYCRPNWEAYACRYGYDIVVVDQLIKHHEDATRRPPHWQKCFILSHPRAGDYEDVVYLDSDILINYRHAPCVVTANRPGYIGAVKFDHYLDDDLNAYLIAIRKSNFLTYNKRAAMRRADDRPAILPPADFSSYYGLYMPGQDESALPRVNSGLLVMKPAVHRERLETIYMQSFEEARDEWVNGDIEIDQTFLTWKLLQAGLIHLLDERFNRIAAFEHAIHYPFTLIHPEETLMRMCFTSMLHNSYFLHFARCQGMMKYALVNADEDFAIVGLPNVFAGDRVSIRHRRTRHTAVDPIEPK